MFADIMFVASIVAFLLLIKEMCSYFKEAGK